VWINIVDIIFSSSDCGETSSCWVATVALVAAWLVNDNSKPPLQTFVAVESMGHKPWPVIHVTHLNLMTHVTRGDPLSAVLRKWQCDGTDRQTDKPRRVTGASCSRCRCGLARRRSHGWRLNVLRRNCSHHHRYRHHRHHHHHQFIAVTHTRTHCDVTTTNIFQ